MAESQAGEGVEATGEVTPGADTPAADALAEPDLVGDALAYLARSLVSNVDDVRVERLQTERGLVYRLHVNSEDMGRVIGRSGRIARALRQVTRAAAARAGVHAIIEIAD
jgi:predicted RNA-binding protein YlqC (UPF0109 family)